MAEDEDGASDKKSPQNSNNAGPSQDNEKNTTKPDLGIEEAKYNSNENGDTSPTEARCSSKSTGATRKEENPFSFRHFLKRDLSLPGNSTYENTGARPKVYANTVQHSPTKVDVHEARRERPRDAKETSDASQQKRVSSSSSVEIPFSVVDSSESKHNFYADSSDVPFYHRPNLASEPLGMPSLPDFVQDHILVEQAYLNSNGPISVDLDNLPDFTFNTSFNAGSSSSLGRRNNSNRGYNYESYMGAASTSNESGNRVVPLDLPAGAEAAGPIPLDLPAHLSLDLTESVNPADRRNMSPRSMFPLDLPPNAGAESMRLPDFLPVHPGRTSPEPEHVGEQLQQIMCELQSTRSELIAERSRRSRAEGETAALRAAVSRLQAETARRGAETDRLQAVAARRGAEAERLQAEAARRGAEAERLQAEAGRARASDRHYAGQLDAATTRAHENLMDTAARATDAEALVSRLRNQIKKLKEELAASQAETRALRQRQAGAACDLRRASSVAETSLRELLAGLEQLKSLSTNLEPT